MAQWKVSVKIETLDRGDVVVVKNRWLAGETVCYDPSRLADKVYVQ